MHLTTLALFAISLSSALLDHVISVAVPHAPATIRKSLRLKGGGSRRDLVRRSEEESLSSEQFMVITTLTDSSSDDAIQMAGSSGQGNWVGGGINVEMMIVGMDESPHEPPRRKPKRFGSRGPLLLEQSSLTREGRNVDQLERIVGGLAENFIDDGAREAMKQMMAIGTFLESFQPTHSGEIRNPDTLKPVVAQTPLPPASSLVREAASEAQEAKPTSQSKAEKIPKAEPHTFFSTPKKQILLGTTPTSPTFDNTSHHSQL